MLSISAFACVVLPVSAPTLGAPICAIASANILRSLATSAGFSASCGCTFAAAKIPVASSTDMEVLNAKCEANAC